MSCVHCLQYPPSLAAFPTPPARGYETLPSVDKIADLSLDQMGSLPNFKVTRKNVGSIQWKKPVDIRSADLLHLVIINPFHIIVDHHIKNEYACFNSPARLEFFNCPVPQKSDGTKVRLEKFLRVMKKKLNPRAWR